MTKPSNVVLYVYVPRKGKERARPMEVTVDLDGNPLTHAAANRMARGVYSGMKTRVKDAGQRKYPKGMRSYADMMAMQ